MAKTMTPSAKIGRQINKATANFRAMLEKHAPEFEPGAVQEVLGEKEFVGECFDNFRKRVEAKMVLAPRGIHTVTLAEPHDPGMFFQARQGLWVYDGFRTLVVAKAKPSEAGAIHKIKNTELIRDLTDAEIEKGLGDGHLFDETAVCAIIAGLIAKQPNGEEGMLKNNGYANLFYLSSCVVRVFWSADLRKWFVGAWERVGNGWSAGSRVSSPAA